MTKLSKIISGRKAKKVGAEFEDLLHVQCTANGWQVVKMPMGAKMLNAHKMIRVRTDFDFVFAKKFPQVIFADAKCVEAKAFSASRITPHQLKAILGLERRGFKAGYIVNFSNKFSTVWFSASQLAGLTRGQSLKPEEGIYLGTSNRIDLDMIFKAAPNHMTSQVIDV